MLITNEPDVKLHAVFCDIISKKSAYAIYPANFLSLHSIDTSVIVIRHRVPCRGVMSSRPDPEADGDYIVFYDGYCVLCSKSIDFILSRDRLAKFRFASLQSDFSQTVFSREGYPIANIQNFSNVVYLRRNVLKIKSDAVLSVLWDLGGIYKVTCLGYLLPRFVRDFAYDRLAKVRYMVFGKRDTCRVPTPDEISRFLG